MPFLSLSDPSSVAAAFIAALLALWFWTRFAGRNEDGASWTASAVKTGAVALLMVAGALAHAPWLIVLGLGLGALGDFALSRPGKAWFLAGMAAFALGHLAYVGAFWTRASDLGFAVPSGFQWAGLAMLAAAVLGLGGWLASKAGDLRGPVMVYACLIGLMAAMVVILPPHPGRALLVTGAALFLLSDALLGLRMFVVTAPQARLRLGLAVWPAYWAGQALILMGALAYSAGAQG